jgi:hypothetical protein
MTRMGNIDNVSSRWPPHASILSHILKSDTFLALYAFTPFFHFPYAFARTVFLSYSPSAMQGGSAIQFPVSQKAR